MILHPDTLSWCWDSRRILALACMFMSGMNSFPCQLPSLRSSRWVSRCVPTKLDVVFLESCLALSLAHAIVPHGLCPQFAIFMMLLPPGLRQIPAIDDGWCDDGWCAAAAMASAPIKASPGMSPPARMQKVYRSPRGL